MPQIDCMTAGTMVQMCTKSAGSTWFAGREAIPVVLLRHQRGENYMWSPDVTSALIVTSFQLHHMVNALKQNLVLCGKTHEEAQLFEVYETWKSLAHHVGVDYYSCYWLYMSHSSPLVSLSNTLALQLAYRLWRRKRSVSFQQQPENPMVKSTWT